MPSSARMRNCLPLAGLGCGHGREGLELRREFQSVGRSSEPVLVWGTLPDWGEDHQTGGGEVLLLAAY